MTATPAAQDFEPAATTTVSSQVTVGVDAATAFRAFTDEMNLWWVRGPINFHDSARATGIRCEPGVGGRLLELYGSGQADALETGRITTWHPGEVVAWDSSLDDVRVEVRFEPVTDGTVVTVTATIPAGGSDQGGTSWVRVTPRWLGDWCARRDGAPRQPVENDRLALALYYDKPAAAARWLAEIFGLTPVLELTGDDEHSWIEFRVGRCSVMLFSREPDGGRPRPVTHVPWVFVDDLEAHLAKARDRGAAILSDIHQHGYRAYEAADLEGNRWTFAQARPTM
ncbi:MAG TPA: VOC family protein [Streptosporangiaceae bacterium]